MSDRTFVSSDMAFGSLLSSMQRRASTAKRRQRWPGATQLATGGVVSTAPTALGITTWSTLKTIDLDAGAWVLLATSTIVLQAGAGTTGNRFRAGLSYTDDEQCEIAGPDPSQTSDGTAGWQQLELSLNAHFRLTSRTTLTLRKFVAYQGTLLVDPYFDNTFILAIPT